MGKCVEKVIIIGSGPAGLTAAIYAARANLKPLMIEGEEAGGQLMSTTDVENFPGFPDGVMGPELMEILKKQATRFGTRYISKNVTKVNFSQTPIEIFVGEEKYQSQSIIISTGATAKYLGLPSEKAFLGRGLSACATCDGAFFKDVEVAIVGGGDTAMEEALFLTRFASKIYVIHRRDSFRASKIMAERVLSHEKIEVLWNTEVKEIMGDKEVDAISLWNNKEQREYKMPINGVFIAIGHRPNTTLFKNILDMDEVGYLNTKLGSTYTNKAGVFACGDVQDKTYRQAVTAAGTGCMAAMDAEKWLESESYD